MARVLPLRYHRSGGSHASLHARRAHDRRRDIGILAAIAIPAFHEYQLKAKRTEAFTNADGIAVAIDAEAALSEVASGTTTFHPRPVANLDKLAAPWTLPTPNGFVDYAPDGAVRCTYDASWSGNNVRCNIDDDGTDFVIRWYPLFADAPMRYNSQWDGAVSCNRDDAPCDCY